MRSLLALLALPLLTTATIPAVAQPSRAPVVVELYQSQGCSSCPPALANLAAIADRPDVIALSFGVTYWDKLGWKDGFASPQYTARQWDYARANKRPNVATPQVWINGRSTIVGGNRAQLDAAIARAAPLAGPKLMLAGNAVAIGAGAAPASGADVWLVRYDPRSIQVAIKAGENGGRTLAHRDIVRHMVKVGRWSGKPARIALPAASGGLRTAILVQAGTGGPIIAAVKG